VAKIEEKSNGAARQQAALYLPLPIALLNYLRYKFSYGRIYNICGADRRIPDVERQEIAGCHFSQSAKRGSGWGSSGAGSAKRQRHLVQV
jgi:hypothetical protein